MKCELCKGNKNVQLTNQLYFRNGWFPIRLCQECFYSQMGEAWMEIDYMFNSKR